MSHRYCIADATKVINGLPPFSDVVKEGLTTRNSKAPAFGRLATIIGRDPVLAVRVLRVANSSFFGMRGRVAGRYAGAARVRPRLPGCCAE